MARRRARVLMTVAASLNEDGVTLPQPRLVADADIKGGRYVSNVVGIYGGFGPAS